MTGQTEHVSDNEDTGSELMRRIAVPIVGGMASSTLFTLLVVPAVYVIVKGWRLFFGAEAREPAGQRATTLAE